MNVKSVEWAYPTSTCARRFGCGPIGCWVVDVGQRGEPLRVAVAAFETREQAIDHALALPHEWSFAFLFCNPEYRRAA
jgi:hypothetical protein